MFDPHSIETQVAAAAASLPEGRNGMVIIYGDPGSASVELVERLNNNWTVTARGTYDGKFSGDLEVVGSW